MRLFKLLLFAILSLVVFFVVFMLLASVLLLGTALLHINVDVISSLLFIMATALFVIIPIYLAKKTKLSKSSIFQNTPKPEHKQKMNIRFFGSATILIKKIYPEESIIKKSLAVEFANLSLLRVGNIPLLPGIQFNIIPLPIILIETDKSYYIDKRPQAILYPFGFLLAFYVLKPITDSLSSSGLSTISIVTLYIVFIIGMLWVIFVTVVTGFSNIAIDVVKKSWLTTVKKDGGQIRLKGTIPENEQPYLTTNRFLETGSTNLNFYRLIFAFS